MGQGAAASSRGRGLADRRAPRVGREEILSRQLGRRNGPPQLSCDDQGTMDLRAGPSTVEGGTRARPLRGKVLARPSSSCADGDDCLRVPPTSPAQKSEAGKKESTARPLNRRCRRFATPSSTSSCDQVLSDVRTADPGSARKSIVSKSAKVVLVVANTMTKWPGELATSSIAMIDTGGGPASLSDPKKCLWAKDWPSPAP